MSSDNASGTSSDRWRQSDQDRYRIADATGDQETSATRVDLFAENVSRGRAFSAYAALQDGREPVTLTDETAAALGKHLSTNAASMGVSPGDSMRGRQYAVTYSETARGPNGPGRSHDGFRDYYDVFGYPEPGSTTAADFAQRARVQDIAHIIANQPVGPTWRHQPIIRDDGREEDADPTQFEQDVQRLFDGGMSAPTQAIKRSGLRTYWEWVDREQRPVQYGLLHFGYADGRAKTQPVDANALNGPDDLAFCNVFSQADVTNWALADDFDPGEPIRNGVTRPDKPVLYEIEVERSKPDGSSYSEKEIVHYTRLRHIVESPGKTEFIGQSCLEPLLHRLIDFEKGYGAAGEAHLANAERKFIGNATGDSSFGADREEMLRDFDRQMREMKHGGRTTAYTENVDLQVVGGEDVDPSGFLDALFKPTSGVSGIPQRIMTGSERGDLASSQDDANFYGRIGDRQSQYGERRVVRPTIDDFIRYGIVAEPEHPDNSYTVTWPNLFELTELEEAQLSERKAKTLKNLEDAVAMGADRQTSYEYANVPLPDDGGNVGSGSESGDMATNIDESDPEVRDQFASMRHGPDTANSSKPAPHD